MSNFTNLLGEWARSRRATPAWAVALEALTLQQFAAPALPPLPALGRGFAAIRDAACADLLRRFADPVRVVDVDGVRIVNVLDAVVYIHDRTQRHVSVAAWQPDGTLVINTISRFEIGHPLILVRNRICHNYGTMISEVRNGQTSERRRAKEVGASIGSQRQDSGRFAARASDSAAAGVGFEPGANRAGHRPVSERDLQAA